VYAIPQAWYDAHDGPGKQLLCVVEFLGRNIHVSNVAWGQGQPWVYDAGAYYDSDLLYGEGHAPTESILLSLRGGSVEGLEVTLDSYSGLAQVAQVTLTMSNTTGVAARLGSGAVKSSVRILFGVGGVLGHLELLPLFFGHIESIRADSRTCVVDVVPGAFAWHHDLSLRVDRETFPNAPDDSQGQVIPITIGNASNVQAIAITSTVAGTLAIAAAAGGTVVHLAEIDAGFPASGEIVIAATTYTYTRKVITYYNDRDVLSLSGLSPVLAASYIVGTVVTHTPATWRYALGTAAIVRAVKRDGALLDPVDYTVDTLTVNQIPVTRVSMATPGIITADLAGAYLPQESINLVNPGFETGDTTGWTIVSGTLDVTTGETPSPGSVYKGELTGGVIRQTLNVPGGRQIWLSVAAREQFAVAGNVLSPTGWTLTYQAESTPALDVDYGASNELGPWTVQNPEEFIGAGETVWYRTIHEQAFTVTPSATYVLRAGFFEWGLAAGRFVPGAGYTPVSRVTERLTIIRASDGEIILSVLDPIVFFVNQTFIPTETDYILRAEVYSYGIDFPPLNVDVIHLTIMLLDATGFTTFAIRVRRPDLSAYTLTTLPGLTVPGTPWGIHVYSTMTDAEESQAILEIEATHDNPAIPLPVWFDDIVVGVERMRLPDAPLGPVDAIRQIIEAYVPGLRINDARFSAMIPQRSQWFCGGQWRNPGDSRALLTHLADQFAMRLFEDGAGRATLAPIVGQALPGDAVAALDRSNARDWQISDIDRSLLSTDIYLYYGLRQGADEDEPRNYGGFLFATPEASNAGGIFRYLCDQAARTYGMRQVRTYFAQAIYDQATAALKLADLVIRHTTPTRRVQCAVLNLRQAPLEIGDIITVEHPELPDGPFYAEVLRVAPDLSLPAIEVACELKNSTADTNEWEPVVFLDLFLPDDNEWDSGIDSIGLTASDNEWEPREFAVVGTDDHEWNPRTFTDGTPDDHDWETGPAF